MDRLWAPWRMKYVSKPSKSKCVFCKVYRERKDAANFIILRSEYSFVVLNIYPYNNGHIMVVPNRHVKNLENLSKEEILDLMTTTIRAKNTIKDRLNPDGFNIGMNIGKVSGAGIESHLHIHIVPRWKGDTNFMPIIGNTKVLPQSLKALYKTLK